MIDASLTLTAPGQDLGTLTVKHAISSSAITTAGSIGTIKAQSLLNSIVYAGIIASSGQTSLPGNVGDIAAANFGGSCFDWLDNREHVYQFEHRRPRCLGVLALGITASINAGTAFGIATSSFRRFSAVDKSTHKSLVFSNIHDAATLLSQIEARNLVLTDLRLNIV